MTFAEKIYRHSLRLPEQAAREALDFIEFLEQRYGILDPDETIEPTHEETCRQALEQLARVRIAWNGKPIADRNRLYDEARSGG